MTNCISMLKLSATTALSLVIATGVLVSPVTAGVIFADEFNGTSLDPAWNVVSGQGTTQVSGGALRYNNFGPLSSPFGWYTTSTRVELPFSGRHWQLDTKVDYSLVYLNGLGNSSGAQTSIVDMEFARATFPTDFLEVGRSVDAWYNDNSFYVVTQSNNGGQASSGNVRNPADTVQNNIAGGTYWLRFIRNGGTISFLYSYDGTNYTNGVTRNIDDPNNSNNLFRISGTTWETVGSHSQFDYVRIQDTVPEPAGFALMLGGGAALWVLRRRRS